MTDCHMSHDSSFSSESVQTLFLVSLQGVQNIWSRDETIVSCDNGMSCSLIEVS